MNILLLRPHPGNDRFGLGPFFRVEPLGLEYIGAALRAGGHAVTLADLRFRLGAPAWVRRSRPRLVGISCLHALERHGLQRAGFTILTPLPGTDFYDKFAGRIAEQAWSNFDMHHLLWEPRLGARRFFELYAETWRRSILNTSGEKSLFDWMRQVRPSQIPYIVRVLWRTQRMMKPAAYLREYEATRPKTAPFA